MKFCIIGKSKRLEILTRNLKNSGIYVDTITSILELKNQINADYIVLPIPTLNKDRTINLNEEQYIEKETLFEKISPSTKIISCGLASAKHLTVDLASREDFAYLNAVPTAEGAILYALQNTEISLFESNILITGFGRVSKLLANRLTGLCPNITIAARSETNLSYAEALGYKTIQIKDLKNAISTFNIIFQTVPAPIISKEIIDKMSNQHTIIELSSQSVGTNFKYAEVKGIKVVHAPALPEKILPQTAGNILTKCILSIITEYK